MAKLQCKMCGGMVEIAEGTSIAECPYCGSTTTFPKATDERVERLYARAEHFRQVSEFDKAVAAYEEIVRECPDDAEAYWGLVLSRFGIEYVEDPVSHERVPTCHRVQYDSILADADYLAALEKAGAAERDVYEAEARRIAEIQKGILAISAQEKPFDVFICYKETTEGGSRTKDSVTAQEIYYQLTNEGYKVFFARITLEGKLGRQYEPYIFAALNSAKVMLVIGTKREYFNAVWVKNEWSRFLALMKNDRSRLLIPCYRDMDAYDLPEELSMLQSQDMSKIGFIQDLLHGIRKVVSSGKPSGTASAKSTASSEVAPLLKRIPLFLETQDFGQAKAYCERVLDRDPENAEAYLFRLMAEQRTCSEERLYAIPNDLESLNSFRLALKFADAPMKARLQALVKGQVDERRFQELLAKFKSARSMAEYRELAARFAELGGYGKAEEFRRKCEEIARELEEAAVAAYRKKCDEALRMQNSSASPEAWEVLASEFDELKEDVPKAADAAMQCREMARQIRYEEYHKKCDEALRMQEAGDEAEALEALALEFKEMMEKIPEAADTAVQCWELAQQLRYRQAMRMKEDRRYGEAVEWFQRLPDGYADAAAQIQECAALERKLKIKRIVAILGASFLALVLVLGIGCIVHIVHTRSRIRKLIAEAKVAEQQGDWQTMERLADELHGLSQADSEAVQKRADKLNGGQTTTLTLNGVALRLRRIPAGTFMMGSPTNELGRNDDEPPHRVTITRDFWLGKYEVTQAQWEAVMGNNPSRFKRGDLPVESISWDDAKAFCEKLNQDSSIRRPEGYRFDLPTEAQWEYACRAGTTTALNNGQNLANPEGNDSALNEVGWYEESFGSSTHSVGRKKPNAWRLYDMHGNVCEWCRDWYGAYDGDATDPDGPGSGSRRVIRGGGWLSFARDCRAARRDDDSPGFRISLLSYLGFRLALVPVQQ